MIVEYKKIIIIYEMLLLKKNHALIKKRIATMFFFVYIKLALSIHIDGNNKAKSLHCGNIVFLGRR